MNSRNEHKSHTSIYRMSKTPGLPFAAVRWSSATSVDVKLKPSGNWVGLAGVAGINAEELVRQAKQGLSPTNNFDEVKAAFLVSLPRLLLWCGAECVSEGDAGQEPFLPAGKSITCELENPETGEIDDAQVAVTEENAKCAAAAAHEAMAELAMKQAAAGRHGLDSMGDQQGSSASGAGGMGRGGRSSTADYDQGGDGDEDEDDDEDADEVTGVVDASAPAELLQAVVGKQFASIIATAAMLGLRPEDIKAAFAKAGGVVPESSPEDEHQHEGVVGGNPMAAMMAAMQAGGPSGGAPPAECKQQ
jgi:hypothetical protein